MSKPALKFKGWKENVVKYMVDGIWPVMATWNMHAQSSCLTQKLDGQSQTGVTCLQVLR